MCDYILTDNEIPKIKACGIVTRSAESDSPVNNVCVGNTCLWTATCLTMVGLEQCFMGSKVRAHWGFFLWIILWKIACGL